MTTVTLKPLHHRNQECIGIFYENSSDINRIVKESASAKWSQSNKCWYIILNKENYQKLSAALSGKAKIERSLLDKYLSAKKTNSIKQSNLVSTQKPVIIPDSKSLKNKPPDIKYKPLTAISKIDIVNEKVLPLMEQRLKLKAYSPSTIKTYLNEMGAFIGLLKSVAADSLTADDLKRYLVYCYDKLKLSENTLHSRMNAMKFYYEQVLGRENFFWDIPRPKKPFQLPKLLNEDELTRLFNALTNKKHKAMLFTAYSSGLRVSEIVNLKIADIDSDRMQILVEQANPNSVSNPNNSTNIHQCEK